MKNGRFKSTSLGVLIAVLILVFGGTAGCTQEHVESITISEGSFQEQYALDAPLDLENARISVKTSKGSRTEPVTRDMVGGFDTSRVGERTLTVYYGGKTAEFRYRVMHTLPVLSSMRLTAELNGQTLTVRVNRPDYPIYALDFTVIVAGEAAPKVEGNPNFSTIGVHPPEGSGRVRIVMVGTSPVEKECVVATIRGNILSATIENVLFSDGSQDYIVPDYSADK